MNSIDSIAFLREHYPTVQIIQNDINGGFAKGYNDALKKIEADVFCLLNSDVEVSENWLEPIIDCFQNNPNTAIIQPKILDYHTKDFYILEHGEIWNNDRVRLFMKTSLDRETLPKRVNRMEYHTIEKYGDAINIAYDNYGEFYQGDSLVWEGHWLESAFIIPTETGWRIRTMHSTRTPVEQTK